MRFVTLDLETFFSDDYTLSKMSTEAYVRDPRFQAHGAAIKWDPQQKAVWYDEPELRRVLKETDWSDVFLIHHHAQFDGLILSHHYGVRPFMWGDTLSMARLLLGNHLSVSLDSVRKHFGLPAKLTPYHLFRGKHWHELPLQHQKLIGEGACDEVESIWMLFGLLLKDFPREELQVVHETVRMFTEPVLQADVSLLARIWERENEAKAERLQRLNIDVSELQSADKFKALLEAEGVEIEYKDGKNGPIPCFAKGDDFMRDLLEDADERVRGLAEARLGAKSTMLQTRAETLGWMARRGPMCVYLRMYGAHTTRWSGGDGGNWQNFKRKGQEEGLRDAILPPPGYLLLGPDLSQVECRVLSYLAGHEESLQEFRRDEDPYIKLASAAYGEAIYKPEKNDPRRLEMETKRGTGKQLRLSCLGPDTRVLTRSGLKFITAVEQNDTLWDGFEWVNHRGVIFKGEKNVVNIAGLTITQDHLVLCGNDWLPAGSLQNEATLFLALAKGLENLPLPATSWASTTALSTLSFNAPAERQNTLLPLTTWFLEKVRVAMLALKKQPGIGLRNTTAMPMFAPMTSIDDACWGVSPLFTTAAKQDQNITPMRIMAAGVFKSTDLGAKAGASFWRIWSRSLAGINQICGLTGLTTKRGIVPAIFDSPMQPCRPITKESFAISKTKSLTYDIACAGPRNRFTVVTDAGPLIVHNCGFQAGAKTIQRTARLGIYGPPVYIDIDEALRWRDVYRGLNQPIVEYWKTAGRMLSRLAGGPPLEWGPFTIRDKKIYLPNGLRINYDTLEFYRDPDTGDENWRVKKRNGWTKFYSGKLVENVVQFAARCIASQALLRISRLGYRIVNTEHDKHWVLIPDDGQKEQHMQQIQQEMTREPDWLPGIPLGCEI